MQGIAGFFKSVIKPYAVASADVNAPESSESSKEKRNETDEIRSVDDHAEDKRAEKMPPEKLKTTMEHDECLNETRETIYDLIKDIRDPEKPNSLEELDVVSEDNISVCKFNQDSYLIQITFVPTVPHCSLASLIGLCLRQKLMQDFPEKHKLDIFVKDGTHETADEVNKQINDKERIAAALENPNLRELVDQCISNDFG